MNKQFQSLLIVVTLLATRLGGEPVVTPVDFSNLPLDEALKVFDRTSGYFGSAEFARSAVESKRMDLIQACFKSSANSDSIRKAIAGLPDSAYKDSLVLMMLETQSSYWPSYERRGSFNVVLEIEQEPFREFIEKWLPDREFNKETTIETRRQLADEARAIMARTVSDKESDYFSNHISANTMVMDEGRPPKIRILEEDNGAIAVKNAEGFNWVWVSFFAITVMIGLIRLRRFFHSV